MHSPVWQNYDPAYDTTESFTDWEYESDEYYDQEYSKYREASGDVPVEHSRNLKRKRIGAEPKRRQRRKLNATQDIPDLNLGESIGSDRNISLSPTPFVIWKKPDEPPSLPVVVDGQGEMVALLKDWREKFKDIAADYHHAASNQAPIEDSPKQKGVAVIIERQPSESDGPTKSKAHPHTSPSRKMALPNRKVSTNGKSKSSFLEASMNDNKKTEEVTTSISRQPVLVQSANGITSTKQTVPRNTKDEGEKHSTRCAAPDVKDHEPDRDPTKSISSGGRKRKAQEPLPTPVPRVKGKTARKNSATPAEAAKETAADRRSKRSKRA